jgi:hypothetical protein
MRNDESRQEPQRKAAVSLAALAVSVLLAVCVTAADRVTVARDAAVPKPARPAASQPASQPASPGGETGKRTSGQIADPKQVGGEAESIVQVANLVYAGTKSSKCFSDHFLAQAEKSSAISTSRRFHAVKLGASELFDFPLVIMTGEGVFSLPDGERENLRKFVERGGFLLASAGCSSQEWDRSFRNEMAKVFPDNPLQTVGMEHPVFHMVNEIKALNARHGKPRPLEGVHIGGRLGVLYSQDGLNDTEHTQGCCCCGGNEITNCVEINVNVLAYALTY